MEIKTIKVLPSSEEQGAFVIINESDFDPKVHTLYEEKAAPTRADLDNALASLPGSNKDPEYVVRSMRAFFGDLFTDEDEKHVREVVKPPKPSDGLTVAEIKAALTAKSIAIPDGALKPALAALLDEAA